MSTDQQAPSRRNFVTGLALAAPVAAVAMPALAFAMPIEPDPIFAAIGSAPPRRAIYLAIVRPWINDAATRTRSVASLLHDAVTDAEDGFLDVIPTTLAGAVALLTYVADHSCMGNMMGGCHYEADSRSAAVWPVSLKGGVSWEHHPVSQFSASDRGHHRGEGGGVTCM